MRRSAIWRETLRSVATGTSRAVLFGMLLTVAVVPLQLADASAVTSIVQEAIRYQTSGASVSILTADGAVDGRACEALKEIEGVRAAGAIRASDGTITASTMPSSPIPTWNVTPSFGRMVDALPLARGAGILLGSEAADLLGMSAGSDLHTVGGQVQVAGVYDSPSDGRRAGYAYAALIVETPARPYDECWMDAWPTLSSSTELLMTTVLPSSGADQNTPSIGQLNSTLGSRFDPYSAFSHRITSLAAPTIALLALAVGFASVRSRRVQLASALHAGVSHRALSAMALIEAAFWTVPVVLVSLAACLVVGTTVPSIDRVSLVITTLAQCALIVLGVASGVALGAATIRERHLFAYFKDR